MRTRNSRGAETGGDRSRRLADARHDPTPTGGSGSAQRWADLTGGPVDPASAVDAWAGLVVRVIPAERDPKTLAAWAELVNMSTSALRQRCYAAGVSPKRSLHFARLLRGVARAEGRRWEAAQWLEAADIRTLRVLLRGGGLQLRCEVPPSVAVFLGTQTVLERDSPLIDAVRRRLAAVV
jgi:AraC-like DNA-binding protein